MLAANTTDLRLFLLSVKLLLEFQLILKIANIPSYVFFTLFLVVFISEIYSCRHCQEAAELAKNKVTSAVLTVNIGSDAKAIKRAIDEIKKVQRITL